MPGYKRGEKPLRKREEEAYRLARAGARGRAEYRQPLRKPSMIQQAELIAKGKNIPVSEALLLLKRQPKKEPTLSPKDIKNLRRSIAKDVNAQVIKLKDQDPTDPAVIENYRANLGIHLDMGSKYSKYLKYRDEGLANQEELKYIDKAELTKAWFERHKDERDFTFESIAPSVRNKLDAPILKRLFDIYKKKKGKKFLLF